MAIERQPTPIYETRPGILDATGQIRGAMNRVKEIDAEIKTAEVQGDLLTRDALQEQCMPERFQLALNILHYRRYNIPELKVLVHYEPDDSGDTQKNCVKITVRDRSNGFKSFLRIPAPETFFDERGDKLMEAIGGYDPKQQPIR